MRYAIAVILIIIFAVVAIIFFGRSSDNPNRNQGEVTRVTKLSDYAENSMASVSWTMQGKVVGEDLFKSVRITVTPRSRTVEILSGYNQITERQQEFGNTPEAFRTFTRSLDLANFGRERKVQIADERGVCPLGNRYVYRVTDGLREVMRSWSTSCRTSDGPFSGNSSLVSQLFKNQITDYSKFMSGVRL